MTGYTRRTVLASVGATTAVVLAGCSSGSADDDQGGDDGTTTAGDDAGTDGGSASWTETDTVDMTDDLVFDPERIRVSQGTTVTWENVGAVAHSVTAYDDGIPDGAAYFASGGADSQQAAVDAYPDEGSIAEGGTYEHTFDTTGTYEYYCIPPEMSGMVGYVEVV
jgi:plastocyanin